MKIYALIHNGIDTGRREDFDGDPPVLAPEKGMVWVPVVNTPQPAHDAATHTVEGGSYALEDGQLVRQWTIRSLTLEEIEARAPKPVFLEPLEFRELIVGIVGRNAWDEARANPALQIGFETLFLSRRGVDPADMPQFFEALVYFDHMTEAQVEQVWAQWRRA